MLKTDEDSPVVKMLRPEQSREAEKLVAALEDYNWTQTRFWNDLRENMKKAVPRGPTPAEREAHRMRAKRDAIFRDMVEHVDAWGNVVADGPKARHHDLRKNAKTVNFMPHPFEGSTVKLADPNAREKLAEINEALREGTEDLKELTKRARR
jgi:CHAD domain-containing protein